jgi:hypothetical protein
MVLRQIAISAGALVVAIAVQGNSANALSMQECSAKYNAAKEAGTLGGMKWNDFRKAQCGADATAAPTPFGSAPGSNYTAAESYSGQAFSRAHTRCDRQRGISQCSIAPVLG